MKLLSWMLVLAICLTWATTSSAQSYTATIDGLQEAPPNASPATGSATMTLDGAKMLSFSISYSNLMGTETVAHFHGPAPVGNNAGVQFGLPAGNPKNGFVGPLSPAQEADLNAGLWYINIHTDHYPGGEIRGQVTKVTVSNDLDSWGRVKALFNAR